MTANTSLTTQSDSKRSLWTGVVLAFLGLVGIFLPVFTTFVTESWIAFILLSVGFSKIIYAFQTRTQGGFLWKVLLSVLYIAGGVMLLTQPFSGVITLTLLLGSFLLTEAVFELILAFRLRPQENWTWALGNGLVTLVLGAIVLLGWPTNAPWLLGTAVGASVLSTGISRVMLSFNPAIAGRDNNQNDPNQIDQAASA
ncbi:MAG TPA: DUF308 domain-containing protein [Trichocoleus sp.]